MADRSISTKVAITGDNAYKSALKAIAQELKAVESEMKLTQSTFASEQNTMQALTEKGNVLQEMYTTQSQKLNTLISALQNARTAQTSWQNEITKTQEAIAKNNTNLQQQQSATDAAKAKWESLKSELESAKAEYEVITEMTGDAEYAQEQMGDTIESLTTKVEQAEGAYKQEEAATERLTSEKTKLNDQLTKQSNAYNTATTGVEKYKTEINTTQATLNNLDSELQKNDSLLDEAKASTDGCAKSIDKYGQEVKETQEETKEAETGMNDLADAAQAMSSVMATIGAAQAVQKITDALKECVEAAAEFEYTMAAVEAVSGASDEQLSQLSSQAMDWASSTIYSAQEIAESYETMGRAGWSAEQMLDGMSGTMSLAAASGESLNDMTQITTTALVAFGESASSASHFSDVLAETAADSNTTVAQLGNAFTAVGTTAGNLGYTIDDVSVALGAMADAGLQGELAGTGLATALTRMSGANANASKAMEDLGISMFDESGNARDLASFIGDLRNAFQGLSDEEATNLAYNLAGQRGMKSLLAIVNTSDEEWDELTSSIENCSGAAENMADTRLDTFTGQTELLSDAVSALKIAMGDKLKPAIEGIEETLTDLINGFADAVENSEALAPAITGAAVALGTFTVGVSAATAAVRIYQTLMAAGMLPVMASVAAAIAPWAAGLGIATAAIIALGDAEESTSSKIADLESALSNNESAFSATTSAYNSYKASAEESAASNASLLSSLSSLTAGYNGSKGAAVEINSVIDQLNNNVPGLGLAFDETTGEINMTSEALEQAVAQMEAYDDLVQAIQTRDELKEEFVSARESVIELRNELANAQATLDGFDNSETPVDPAVYDAAVSHVQELTGDLEKAEDQQTRTGEAYLNGCHDVEQLENEYDGLTSETEENTEATDEATSAQERIAEREEAAAEAAAEEAEATAEANDKLREIKAASLDTSGSATELRERYEELEKEYESLDGAGNAVLSSFVEQRLEALNLAATNAELAESFGSISSYAGYTQNDVALYLNAMGVSVDTFAADVDANLKTIMNGFEELDTSSELHLSDITGQLSSNASDYQSWLDDIQAAWRTAQDSGDEGAMGLVQSLYEAGPEYSQAAAELAELGPKELAAQGDAWEAAQQQAIESALSAYAMEAGMSYEEAYKLAHDGAIAYNDVTGEYEEAGAAEADAVGEGQEGEQSTVESSTDTVVQASLTKVTDAADDFETAGQALIQSLAEGISGESSTAETAAETVASDALGKITDQTGDFETAGNTLIDSLADGMTGESGTAETAAETVGNNALAKITGLSGDYETAGTTLADAVAGQISAESETVETAADTVIHAALGKITDCEGEYQDAGTTLANAVATGITDGSESIEGAAQTDMDTALSRIEGYSGDFEAAGEEMATQAGTGYASITQLQDNAETSAEEAGARAKVGADWTSIGTYMMQGLANGITAGRSLAISAAVSAATSAYSAAKAALDINSPSKKAYELGMYFDAGLANGIYDYGDLITDATDDVAAGTYEYAAQALKNYKVYYNTSAADEANYWNVMRSMWAEGTEDRVKADEQYYNAAEKAQTEYLNNQSDAADEAEEIANSKLKTAEQNWSNWCVYHDETSQDEADYWDGIRQTIEEGTQARIDADDKYFKAQKKADEEATQAKEDAENQRLEDAEEYWDEYSDLNETSAEDEKKYWAKILSTMTEGTSAYAAAEKKYNKARREEEKEAAENEQKIADKRKEIAASLAEAQQKYSEDVADAFKEYEKSYTDSLNGIKSSISGTWSIFDDPGSLDTVYKGTLMANLENQVTEIKQWRQNLDKLAERGVDSDFLAMLEDMGVDSSAEVEAITNMSDKELDKYVGLWKEKEALASEEAQTELDGLRTGQSDTLDEINETLKEKLDEADETYADSCKDIKEDALEVLGTLPDDFGALGEQAGAALVAGLASTSGSVSEVAQKLTAAALGIDADDFRGTVTMSDETADVGEATSDVAVEFTGVLQRLAAALEEMTTDESSGDIVINQTINSQAQTAADIYKEALWNARRELLAV